jgi:hypothetical protein
MCFSGTGNCIWDVSLDRVLKALLGCSGLPSVFFGRRDARRGVSPDRVSWAFLGCSGIPNVFFGCEMHIRDVSPDLVSGALLSGSGVPNVLLRCRKLHLGRFPGSGCLGTHGLLWAPQRVLRAAKCTSGTFPRIESPGHSHAVVGSPMCFLGGEMHIRFPGSGLLGAPDSSGVPGVLFRRRKLHLGRFPGSGSLGILGLYWDPQCVFRAAKCTSGTFPRIRSLGRS